MKNQQYPFVDIKTAILSKSKGFDEWCMALDNVADPFLSSCLKIENHYRKTRAFFEDKAGFIYTNNSTVIEDVASCYGLEEKDDYVAIPTYHAIMDWLRDEHDISISLIHDENNGQYSYSINQGNTNQQLNPVSYYRVLELAIQEGLSMIPYDTQVFHSINY